MRVRDALAAAREAGLARLDAQRLLSFHLKQPREWLMAHDEESLPADRTAAFAADVQRRAAGVPLAYLVGEREFHGLALAVSPAVLVPRPETEHLVDWAIELAPAGAAIVDLGTGSGAIALALRHARPDLRVTATDASAAALAVARGNAERLALPVEFVEGDWWVPLAGRRFDIAVSNPPYIAGDDAHLAGLAHEPRAALTPEGDGLAALRCIVDGAAAHLVPGGWLLTEHGFDQAPAVQAQMRAAGFQGVQTRADLAGLARCTACCRPF